MIGKAVKHTSVHIVPFSYGSVCPDQSGSMRIGPQKAIEALTVETRKGAARVWCDSPAVERERMYHHIENLISSGKSTPETIGRKYTLASEARRRFGLPQNLSRKDGPACMHFDFGGQTIPFDIPEVCLYLFETGVGFLAYEIAVLPAEEDAAVPMDMILAANYCLKRINPSLAGEISYQAKKSREETIRETFSFEAFVRALLEPAGPVAFFENSGTEPCQAIVFSSFVLEGGPGEQELGALLMRTSRVLKESYKVPAGFVGSDSVYSSFDNSHWAFALEGVSNLCWLTDDPVTNRFFQAGYTSRLKNTYMGIYILALQQRYTLILYSIQASRLPDNDLLKKKSFESILHTHEDRSCAPLRTNLIQFTLRSNFEQVIGITHINDVYRCMRRALGIEPLMNELSNELTAISERVKISREGRNTRLVTRLTVAGLIFTLIQIIPNLWFVFTQFVWRSADAPAGLPGEPAFFAAIGISLAGLAAILLVGVNRKK